MHRIFREQTPCNKRILTVYISALSLEAAARDLCINIKNKTMPFVTQYLKIVDLSAELSCRGRISLCIVTVCVQGSTLTFFFTCTGHTGSPFIHMGPPSIHYSHQILSMHSISLKGKRVVCGRHAALHGHLTRCRGSGVQELSLK